MTTTAVPDSTVMVTSMRLATQAEQKTGLMAQAIWSQASTMINLHLEGETNLCWRTLYGSYLRPATDDERRRYFDLVGKRGTAVAITSEDDSPRHYSRIDKIAELFPTQEATAPLIPLTFEQAVDKVLGELRRVMIDRQRKYGSKNISRNGEFGVAVRFGDKAERLHNAYFNPDGSPRKEPLDNHQDDTLDDGWVDAANYAVIQLMLRQKIWGLPLVNEKEWLER